MPNKWGIPAYLLVHTYYYVLCIVLKWGYLFIRRLRILPHQVHCCKNGKEPELTRTDFLMP